MRASPDLRKILIVEDDLSIRETMRFFLEMEGYAVDEAPDGKAALDKLRSESAPRLILLDLMMPVMNGYEFLLARARDPRLSEIPVVVVSAFADGAKLESAQAFLDKPIDFDRLSPLIRKYCGPGEEG